MAERISTLPSRPPSEVEWEDLLLRVELMTRALRNAMEELDPVPAGTVLGEMLAREESVAGWLERHAIGRSPEGGTENAANRRVQTTWGDPATLVDRVVSARARTFAMVQRRGLGVWEWSGAFGADGNVSAYQLLAWLVSEDVAALAALRSIGGGREASAC